MFSTDREKKLLAQRSKDYDVESYENYKRKQDEESYLNTGIPGKTLDKIGSGASKVVDVFKDLWYEVSTDRWKKREDAEKKKGKKK